MLLLLPQKSKDNLTPTNESCQRRASAWISEKHRQKATRTHIWIEKVYEPFSRTVFHCTLPCGRLRLKIQPRKLWSMSTHAEPKRYARAGFQLLVHISQNCFWTNRKECKINVEERDNSTHTMKSKICFWGSNNFRDPLSLGKLCVLTQMGATAIKRMIVNHSWPKHLKKRLVSCMSFSRHSPESKENECLKHF